MTPRNFSFAARRLCHRKTTANDFKFKQKLKFLKLFSGFSGHFTRRTFLREIFYENIAIIAIQHSKIYFVDTFGDFFHTVE